MLKQSKAMKLYYIKLKSGGYKVKLYQNQAIARKKENEYTNYDVSYIRLANQEEADRYTYEQARITLECI